MAHFILSEMAKEDILEVWRYIAADSVEAADKFVDAVNERLATLAEKPYLGRPRNELREGFRSLSLGDYLIFYRPAEEGINVGRVVHGARDLTGLL